VARLEDVWFYLQTRQTLGAAAPQSLFTFTQDLTASAQDVSQARTAPSSLFPSWQKPSARGSSQYGAIVMTIMPYQSVRQSPTGAVATLNGVSYPDMTWDTTPKGMLSLVVQGRTARNLGWSQQLAVRLFSDSAIDPVTIVIFPGSAYASGLAFVPGMWVQPAGGVSWLTSASPLVVLATYSSSMTEGIAYGADGQLLDAPLLTRMKLISPDVLISQVVPRSAGCDACDGDAFRAALGETGGRTGPKLLKALTSAPAQTATGHSVAAV
jgi:hypothetical protein